MFIVLCIWRVEFRLGGLWFFGSVGAERSGCGRRWVFVFGVRLVAVVRMFRF